MFSYFSVSNSSSTACEYPTHIVPDYPNQFWRERLQTSGSNPFSDAQNYKTFRNVKDFGVKGDGVSDDTSAIQTAISSNSRCSAVSACQGSTTEPGLIYFPHGTYVTYHKIVYYSNIQKITPFFIAFSIHDTFFIPNNTVFGICYQCSAFYEYE